MISYKVWSSVYENGKLRKKPLVCRMSLATFEMWLDELGGAVHDRSLAIQSFENGNGYPFTCRDESLDKGVVLLEEYDR